MKAFLMYRDRDFDLQRELPPNEKDLTGDLELDTLFDAMSGGDALLRDVARTALLSSLTDPDEIVYRQDILRDCLQQPRVVGEIYGIAVEAIEREKKAYRYYRSPDGILHSSIEVLELFMTFLSRLRRIADSSAGVFRSDGFGVFFRMLATDLDDAYFQTVEDHLRQLRFRQGVLVSARLGQGNRGVDYVLRRPHDTRWTLRQWLTAGVRDPFTLEIAERDESGAQALKELRERGINLVANATAQSTDHILSFFQMLRCELAFYVGCVNLHEQLAAKGEPTCFPSPAAPDSSVLTAQGLYDVCLSLTLKERAVGNELAADGKSLVVMTGANQGGKSTLLRGIGLAQLMLQAGMFAPAESFHASVCTGLFTHYKREEDPAMASGKLDEELSRMREIVDHLTPNSLVLCNESFASTNEREGSQLGREVVRAMVEGGVRVIFVTHLFHLAHGIYSQGMDPALFLRAERQADGRRTFKLVEGEPLPSSYGEDLYRQVFGGAPLRGSITG